MIGVNGLFRLEKVVDVVKRLEKENLEVKKSLEQKEVEIKKISAELKESVRKILVFGKIFFYVFLIFLIKQALFSLRRNLRSRL